MIAEETTAVAPPSRKTPRGRTSPWLAVLGTLALITACSLAKAFLVPIALAALITFLMSPVVGWLERRIGRVPAVLGTVAVVFLLLTGATWGLLRQLDGLSNDLPTFRATLLSKVSQLRSLSRNRTVEELRKTIDTVQRDLSTPPEEMRSARVVVAESAAEYGPFAMFGPVLGLAAPAGLVITLVIFMLLERRDLVDRLVGLAGRRQLVVTVAALDEAGHRVARQLLMQLLVNAIYGVVAGVGLWLLGLPYAAVWAALGAMLRFLPYIGPIIGVVTPIVIAVAALDGWRPALQVTALMLALEVFTNLVLETVLYAGAAGVSQVGLLVSVGFWTWLWGAPGLAMAVPLTVCLVVVGRHVPGLEYLATLMSDAPPLSPSHTFYQRLLADDRGESGDLVRKHVATAPPRTVFDALVLPALIHAETDRLQGRLDLARQQRFVSAVREMLVEVSSVVREAEAEAAAEEPPVDPAAVAPVTPVRLLGYGTADQLNDVALDAFARMVDDLPIETERLSNLLASEVIQRVRDGGYPVVCIAALPPGRPARTRHLVRRLREASPEVTIVVGRWGAAAPGDRAVLRDAGADHVGFTLDDSRRFLRDYLLRRPPAPASTGPPVKGVREAAASGRHPQAPPTAVSARGA